MSTLFETGCCAARVRLNEIIKDAASETLERKDGSVKSGIAVFIGELLVAEVKVRKAKSSSHIEYSI